VWIYSCCLENYNHASAGELLIQVRYHSSSKVFVQEKYYYIGEGVAIGKVLSLE
jgi:hypothetical protein